LFTSAGETLLKVLNFFSQEVDALFGFFIHGAKQRCLV
jgi:hypothetical protein